MKVVSEAVSDEYVFGQYELDDQSQSILLETEVQRAKWEFFDTI